MQLTEFAANKSILYEAKQMSILNVEHLSHGFGDRAIFNDVSFRLLKGEHIGLIGANGEGKSTFMSIITNKNIHTIVKKDSSISIISKTN